MKKWKKVVSSLLACAMLVSLTACGGNGGSSTSQGGSSSTSNVDASGTGEEGGSSGEVYTVRFQYPTMNTAPSEEATVQVEEAINQYLLDNGYNLALDLVITDLSQYLTNIPLALSSGEEMDIVQVMDLQTFTNNGYLAPLQDYLDDELAGINELEGDDLICGTVGENLYAIPVHKGWVLTEKFVYNTSFVEGIDYDMSTVTDFESLLPLFEELHAAYPDVLVMPDAQCLTNVFPNMYDTCIFGTCFATVGDDPTLVNYFETKAFEDICNYAYQFRQNGWVSPEGSTATLTSGDVLSSGGAVGYILGHGNTKESVASTYQAMSSAGETMDAVELGILTDMTTMTLNYGVSYTSENPAAAAQMLDLMWTDEYIINALIYGLEGVSWEWNDEHTALRYPEGMDASNVPYTTQLMCGLFGNQFMMYPFEGVTTEEDLDYMEENLEQAFYSPLYGFTPNAANVATQLAAVTNVYNQYYNALVYGDLDPAVALPQFLDALDAAGINDILAEYQAQAEAWLAEQA